MRFMLKLFFALALIFGGVGCYAFQRVTAYLDTPISADPGLAQVVIAKGETFKGVIAQLEAAGLVSDSLVFKGYGRYIGADANIKAGTYAIARNLTPRDLLEKLQSGGLAPQVRVTIPEGFNRWQIADLLAAEGLVDRRKFLEKVAREDLEGRLFPDTYWIKQGAGVDEVTRVLTDRFDAVFAELIKGAAAEGELRENPRARRDVVNLASLVEKEAQAAKERGLIARVFYNRIDKGMKLETDPTCVYSAENYREIPHPRYCRGAKSNEYSTYLHAGLPPTPIANPGRASLDAALRAPESDMLYFVARQDGTGEHEFAATFEEHQRNVDRYLRQRR